MAAVNPYLIFNGNCEEAFTFYKSAFRHEFSSLSHFEDMPAESPVSEQDRGRILHVALPVGQGTVLMGSDSQGSYGEVKAGDNFSISISTESKEEATRLFTELSTDGQVTMPLDDTFWGAYFGMFTDKFGIAWMINCDTNQLA